LIIKLKGRGVAEGFGRGEALVAKSPISFLGGVNPLNGLIIDKTHELYGETVAGKVLVFPFGKGSTVGSYIIYGLSKHNVKPAAIINIETEPVIAVGCVIAKIPLVDKLEKNPLEIIKNGDFVEVDGGKGIVIMRKNNCKSNF
jgi:predicted aconitase with swiveling domain